MKKLKKNITLDDLAGMVANGFSEMNDHFGVMEKRMKVSEDGQEQIKLRLDNVAYRFELVELQRRVELLEKRAGVKA